MNEFKCEHCDANFINQTSRYKHYISCNLKKCTEKLICGFCNNNYSSLQSLKRHLKVCKKIMQNQQICGLCGRKFSTLRGLQVHVAKCEETKAKNKINKDLELDMQDYTIFEGKIISKNDKDNALKLIKNFDLGNSICFNFRNI